MKCILYSIIMLSFAFAGLCLNAQSPDTLSFFYISGNVLNVSYNTVKEVQFGILAGELGFSSSYGFKFGSSFYIRKYDNINSLAPLSFTFIPYNFNGKGFVNEIDLIFEANAWRAFRSRGDSSENITYLDSRVSITKRNIILKHFDAKLYGGYLVYNPEDYTYYKNILYAGASITFPSFYFFGSLDSVFIQNREDYFKKREEK